MPAPVVTNALSYHHITTAKLTAQAGETWEPVRPRDPGPTNAELTAGDYKTPPAKLRKLMADKAMFHPSDLVPLLAERRIDLSREQVYRLVTQPPQRLSMDTLAALCDMLSCTSNNLIEINTVPTQVTKTAGITREIVLHRVAGRVTTAVAGLDMATALALIPAAAGRSTLRQLDTHPTSHPDALATLLT